MDLAAPSDSEGDQLTSVENASEAVNAAGDDGPNQLHGGTSAETLSGRGGDDLLDGLYGHPLLDGGDGDDVLRYGSEAICGPGVDTVYSAAVVHADCEWIQIDYSGRLLQRQPAAVAGSSARFELPCSPPPGYPNVRRCRFRASVDSADGTRWVKRGEVAEIDLPLSAQPGPFVKVGVDAYLKQPGSRAWSDFVLDYRAELPPPAP